MKRLIKILSIAAVLAIICTFAACNKNDGDTDSSDSERSANDTLTGQWRSEELSDYIYIFNENGSGAYNMGGNVVELNYSTENGKITINFLKEGYSSVTLVYEMDGDRLNIKDSYGKDTFYIRVDE